MRSDEERRALVEQVTAHPLSGMVYGIGMLEHAILMSNVIVRQRDSQTHDPGCATIIVNHQNRWVNNSEACDCWLSKCPVEGHPVKYVEPKWIPEGGVPQTTRREKVYRHCPACNTDQPICTEAHCMVCGADCPPEETP